MIPQVLEVLGKLAVPVRNIGSVEKVVVGDILDGLGQESFLGLKTEIDPGLTHYLAWFFSLDEAPLPVWYLTQRSGPVVHGFESESGLMATIWIGKNEAIRPDKPFRGKQTLKQQRFSLVHYRCNGLR
jgi:hypothetical protein